MITMSPVQSEVRAKINPQLLPKHIGIIMDGNGRWAQRRGLARTKGHKEGLEAAKRVVKAARNLEIPYVSLYTFSTENWKRTQDEVTYLMGLIGGHLKKEFNFYRENDIRVLHSGDLAGLPEIIQREITDVMHDTCNFSSMTVNLAINYGGRNEISRGAKRVISDIQSLISNSPKNLSKDELLQVLQEAKNRFDEKNFFENLDHPEIPDADLIIRSGGERRLSNFLTWQCSYAELQFEETLWPDWNEEVFLKSVLDFQQRCRRFGGL